MIPTYAVIPTRNRPDDLTYAVESLFDQVNGIVIVNNNDALSAVDEVMFSWGERILHVHVPMQPPNLSKLWNTGIDVAVEMAAVAGEEHNLVIANDDAIFPPGWVEAMSHGMRQFDAAAASQPPFDTGSQYIHADVPPSVHTRVTGWAFMLRGELKPRFDERFQWWCGDDDISVWARNNGGLVHVPGYIVENTKANSTTVGVLADIAAQDMQRFVDKHGVRPW